MRYDCKALALVFTIALGGASVKALVPESTTNRFQQITSRNVFGLKEPEKLTTNQPPPQIPKLILTGITTVLGNKRALLKADAAGQPGKPADPAKEQSFILTEGQRDGYVEVLQIDEKAGSVKVNNSGVLMTLTFEKDGAKLPSTTAPPALPGGTIAAIVPPAGTNAGMAFGGTNTAMRPVPNRMPRWPISGNAATTQVPSPTGRPPETTPALPALPPVPGTATAVAPEMQGLTPEEQRIVQQLERAAQPIPVTPRPTASGTYQTPPSEGMSPLGVPPQPYPENPRVILPQ
jgi:hypothetical protein